MSRIEFTSSEFLPLLPEQCQGNPGVYGFELAFWLAQMLARKGIVTTYPQGEDWGWFIEYVDEEESEFTIGCSSMAQPGAGYRQVPLRWCVWITPHTTLKQRLRGMSHDVEVERLLQTVVAGLHEAGIHAEPHAS